MQPELDALQRTSIRQGQRDDHGVITIARLRIANEPLIPHLGRDIETTPVVAKRTAHRTIVPCADIHKARIGPLAEHSIHTQRVVFKVRDGQAHLRRRALRHEAYEGEGSEQEPERRELHPARMLEARGSLHSELRREIGYLERMGEDELDPSRIRELLRYPGLLEATLVDVRVEVVTLLRTLREALEAEDHARVSFTAHALHGLFAMLGAKRATALGRAFEAWCHDDQCPLPTVDTLELAWRSALQALDAVVASSTQAERTRACRPVARDESERD